MILATSVLEPMVMNTPPEAHVHFLTWLAVSPLATSRRRVRDNKLRVNYLHWCDANNAPPLPLLEWGDVLAVHVDRGTDTRGVFFQRRPATIGAIRPNSRWTVKERSLAMQLYSDGVRPCDAFDQFPGRDKQFVWNIFAQVKRQSQNVCACGARRSPGHKMCDPCLAKVRGRLDKLKAQGLCTQCGRPADATLTKCTECLEYRRKPKVKNPNHANQGTGVVRYLGTSAPHTLIEQLPVPVSDWLVVDVFGGSATLTLLARKAGYRAVYNDIHPILGEVVSAVRDGHAAEIVAKSDLLAQGTPAELLDLYARAHELSPTSRAAVMVTVARNVADRNMAKKVMPEVLLDPGGVTYLRRLKEYEALLQGVEICTEDFADLIRRLDGPQVVFLLDPPFLGPDHYEHNLTLERYREMGALLETIQGRFILSTSSTRAGAECVARHPFVWWRTAWVGTTQVRQLTTSNYPLSFDPVDLKSFGIQTDRVPTPGVPRSRSSRPHVPTPRPGDPVPKETGFKIPLVPVQQVDERTWLARNDLYRPFHDTEMNGAKAYQCLSLLHGRLDDIRANYQGTVYSENYLDNTTSAVLARACTELGLRCIIPIGCKDVDTAVAKHKAIRLAREHGAELDVLCQMPAGPVLKSKAKAKYGDRFFHVAFGMDVPNAVADLILDPVAAQVESFRGLPTETMTLVLSTGSGTVFAGLMRGLARTGIRFKRIVSLQVAGYDRSARIRALIGDAKVQAFEHIGDETYPYNRLLHREVGGIELDAQYEAKAWDWAQRELPPDEPVMFFIVGNSNWGRDLPRLGLPVRGPRKTVSWPNGGPARVREAIPDSIPGINHLLTTASQEDPVPTKTDLASATPNKDVKVIIVDDGTDSTDLLPLAVIQVDAGDYGSAGFYRPLDGVFDTANRAINPEHVDELGPIWPFVRRIATVVLFDPGPTKDFVHVIDANHRMVRASAEAEITGKPQILRAVVLDQDRAQAMYEEIEAREGGMEALKQGGTKMATQLSTVIASLTAGGNAGQGNSRPNLLQYLQPRSPWIRPYTDVWGDPTFGTARARAYNMPTIIEARVLADRFLAAGNIFRKNGKNLPRKVTPEEATAMFTACSAGKVAQTIRHLQWWDKVVDGVVSAVGKPKGGPNLRSPEFLVFAILLREDAGNISLGPDYFAEAHERIVAKWGEVNARLAGDYKTFRTVFQALLHAVNYRRQVHFMQVLGNASWQ